MIAHELKIWPIYFEAVLSGRKTFEYRFNDRNYQEGDMLILREYSNGSPYYSLGETRQGYTGRMIACYIGFVLGLGNPPGMCILSLSSKTWPELQDQIFLQHAPEWEE